MIGFGINAICVIIGSLIGLLFKKRIKEKNTDSIFKGLGLVIIVFGLSGAIENANKIDYGFIVVIICIALGIYIGDILKIETRLNNITLKIENKFNRGKISEGLISASTLFCVGAMSIIGTVNAVLGDYTTIYTKSILDFISSIILASTLGLGVLFSSIVVFIYQGILTLIFALLKNSVSIDTISLFSVFLNSVGYILFIGIGLNFFLKEKLKILNMLPSLVLVMIYFGFYLWLN